MARSRLRFRVRDAFLATAIVGLALLAYRSWPMDGILGIVLATADDTVWADGYSESRWRDVKVGMKRDEVYALLGLPLEVRTKCSAFDFDTLRQLPGEAVECWSRTPQNSNYHVRQIIFKGDVVVDKQNEFYLD
jgi:hypothetical protein